MYRVIKVLNNNGVLAFDTERGAEIIMLETGIGFGKRTGVRFERTDGVKIYTLVNRRQEESVLQAVNGLEPVFLEVTAKIIEEAEKRFSSVNHDILLPLADHIALSVKRMKENTELPNPFTSDIRILFPEEFQVASVAGDLIGQACGCAVSEDEIGFITLHIHSALSDENVAQSLDIARLVNESVAAIEAGIEKEIPRGSLGYSRLVTHLRYMIARTRNGERANLDMDTYVKENFPRSYHLAETLCHRMEEQLKLKVASEEIAYLGIHIERVASM